MEVMRRLFEELDKYNDGILKRGDFIMALRTDELVIDFIDAEAVRVFSQTGKKPVILTMDNVLVEIEKD